MGFSVKDPIRGSITGNAGTVNNHTVQSDVPANAIFTDTTYENKAAASGGTDVSLVTTGEKYTWNNKGTGTIEGVSVNGTSIATSGVANITSIPASILTGTVPSGCYTDTTYTAGTGLTLDGTQFKVTQANVSTMINLLGEGTSPTTANDYIITQYAGGGTSTTTYHRRKASNVINGTLVKAALGTDGSTTTQFLNKAGNWATPTDTKNTAGSTDTSNKIYLIGATSQEANPQTYSDDEVYVTNGAMTAKSYSIDNNAIIQYNITEDCIEFNFS